MTRLARCSRSGAAVTRSYTLHHNVYHIKTCQEKLAVPPELVLLTHKRTKQMQTFRAKRLRVEPANSILNCLISRSFIYTSIVKDCRPRIQETSELHVSILTCLLSMTLNCTTKYVFPFAKNTLRYGCTESLGKLLDIFIKTNTFEIPVYLLLKRFLGCMARKQSLPSHIGSPWLQFPVSL